MSSSSSRRPRSPSQCEQVRKVLREPLTGKRVMVPMTTKAFFAGTLQPALSEDNNSNKKKELVLVRMGKDVLVEMDRSEASQYLERRAKILVDNETKLSAAGGRSSPQIARPEMAAKTAIPTKPSSSSPTLPYFEIQEEYDEQGREIRAEAINVMKELEYLQKKKSESRGGGGDDLDRETAGNGVSSSDTLEVAAAAVEPAASKQPKPISDAEYSALSSRLGELARLEEEAEADRSINQRSAKKLQSKGWAKGFLTTTSSKTNQPKTKKFEISSSSAAGPAEVVAIREEQNQVKEIPRIGHRSIVAAAELKPPSSVRSNAIEPEVFSGVIRERLPTSTMTEPSTKQETSDAPRKRMSRFAQERQQRQLAER